MVFRFTWEKTFSLAGGKEHRPSWTATIAQSSPSECQPKHMLKGHDISAQSETNERLPCLGWEFRWVKQKYWEGRDHFLRWMAFPSCISTEGPSNNTGGQESHPSIFCQPQCPKHLLSFEDATCLVSLCARERKKRKVIKKAVWLNKGAHYVCYFCSSNVCLPLFPLRFLEKSDNQGWSSLSASIRESAGLGMGEGQEENCPKVSWFSTNNVFVHVPTTKNYSTEVLSHKRVLSEPPAVPLYHDVKHRFLSDPQRRARLTATAFNALTKQMTFSVFTCHGTHFHVVIDV